MSPFVRQSVLTSPDYPFAPIDAPIKLDQNESAEDFPAELKRLALERMQHASWNRYTELHSESLCAAIGKHDGWPASGVVATTGSNVLISLLIQLSAIGGRVVTVKPNFALYGLDANLLGAALTELPLRDDLSVDAPALISSLKGAPMTEVSGAIYLPRPHAPTGSMTSLGEIESIASAAANWLVVIDEAYVHFSDSSALDLARRFPNLVVLRTFSKAWGLAGLRLGYALCSDEIARQLRKLVPPFAVSALQSITAQVALENPDYLRERVTRVILERARMTRELAHHPSWTVFPSAANFLLVRTPDAAQAYEALLFAKGVLVRRQDSYFGLGGCIRVTIGTAAENDAFLAAARLIQA